MEETRRALARAEREHALLRYATAQLVESVDADRLVESAVWAGKLECALVDATEAQGELSDTVRALALKLLGGEVESLAELAVRLTTAAIARQLETLLAALVDVGQALSRKLFVGRFASIGEVVVYVRAELIRINERWCQYRWPDDSETVIVEAQRRARCRRMLDAAQGALMTIGHAADVAHFLRAGKALEALPEVKLACAELAKLIGVLLVPDARVRLSWVG